MASVSWTDSIGAATLQPVKTTGPASRFRGWRTVPVVVGPRHHALGSGTPHVFEFRTDRVATFRQEGISHTDAGLVERLQLHLARGGEVTVTTGDAASRVYTCTLPPDVPPPEPEWDGQMREFALTYTLRSTTDVAMICVYP